MAKMIFFILLNVLVLSTAAAKFEYLEEWNMWKADHGKSYDSEREELERHFLWLSSKAYIEAHNANFHIFGYKVAMNHFGDLTEAEYLQLLAYQPTKNYTNSKIYRPQAVDSYPDSIDWRTKGVVTSVKNQGQCGASYAFSAMGALEGAWGLAHGNPSALSEQNIVDCSVSFGNHGCQGGNMYNAYQYVIANEGVDTLSTYSFQGKQTSCSYNKKYRGASMSGTVSITSGSESDLMNAVTNVGPASTAVDASSNGFRYYSSGVYDSSRCSSSNINHAVLITGYGEYSGKYYWLVKNSWGTNWGMSGYVLMARNKYNQCGIATDASYPTL